MNNSAALTIHFAPYLNQSTLIAIIAAGALLLLFSAWLYRRGLLWRGMVFFTFLMLFLNPSLVEERREPVPDIAVVIADRSPSQQNGDRLKRIDEAVAAIKSQVRGNQNITLRIVDSPAAGDPLAQETKLFAAADQAFADVPLARRAGTILLTDGQVHDVPRNDAQLQEYGPVHALLSGDHHERDRQLIVVEAPAYGIVGQDVTIKYRVEDTQDKDGTASVIVRANGKPIMRTVPVNKDQTITVKIDHAGQNVFDIESTSLDNELTATNNRAPVIVNGVHDRLHVLLVSGQPHNGGRTWRDMLTSDPGVDLVHFTILREPDKLDMTPQNELSLIPFPFNELFQVKLYNFDLIIFDQYRLNRILPDYYFTNIVKYVNDGGALLEVSGPSFATDQSIYNTELKSVLPGSPTGGVTEQSFRPALTEIGKRHPVTDGLTGSDGKSWGSWLRQIGVRADKGEVLLSGTNHQPLLILDHVNKGRVAQLASDQIWLWNRGYEGGGPHTELMRRLAHWLMKEPQLEENALDAKIKDGSLLIRRHTLDSKPMDVKITDPDGVTKTLSMVPGTDDVLQVRDTAQLLGIYTVNDGTQTRFAISGELNPPELRAVVTTDKVLAPVVKNSDGSIIWLTDTPHPTVRVLPQGRSYGGRSWLGLRESNSYNVTGINERPIMPMYGWALVLLGLLIGAWWMEGRRRKTV